MESIIKADIFFIISSVATISVSIFVVVLLFYLIKAGKNLYALSNMLKSNFKESEEFIIELKERLENSVVFRIFFPPARKKRKAKTQE